MKTQIDYLAAILTAALSQKVMPGVDLLQAKWDVLLPFLQSYKLMQMAQNAINFYSKNGQTLPDDKVCKAIRSAAVPALVEHLNREKSVVAFTKTWLAEGKRALVLGGLGLAKFYPNASFYGDNELLCLPIYKEQKGDEEPTETQRFEFETLQITIPASAEGPFSGKRGSEHDAVLRKAFVAGPCTLDYLRGLALPNITFLALYHLYNAQQQLLHTTLPLRMVIDWAMLVRHISADAKDFNWADLLEMVDDLGLTSFAQALTALAVRLTGISVPDGAASLTASPADVEYMFKCAVQPGTAAADEHQGRLSRFIGTLRNSKKYSRFSDISPAAEAFHHLFS